MSDDDLKESDFANGNGFIYVVWFDRLKFCGCGMPEAVLARFRDTLQAIKLRTEGWHTKKPEADMKPLYAAINAAAGTDDAARYMTLYALSAADLIEHGGSVGGGWLTADGEKFLAALLAIDEDDWLSDDLLA